MGKTNISVAKSVGSGVVGVSSNGSFAGGKS